MVLTVRPESLGIESKGAERNMSSGLGFLQGRWIMRSFDPSLTFGQAAERTSKIIDEESKELKKGFSAFRDANAGVKTRSDDPIHCSHPW